MSKVIAIDFGINGAMAYFENEVLDDLKDVPKKKIILKKATYKFKHKDPKILVKSGVNIGKRAKVIKRPAKDKTVIDFEEIIEDMVKTYPDYVVLEKVAFMRMNSGTLTKIENHGILKGILMSHDIPFYEVPAITWKKKLNVTSDKSTSLKMAGKLFEGWDFPRDDHAEAALIGHWYFNYHQLL